MFFYLIQDTGLTFNKYLTSLHFFLNILYNVLGRHFPKLFFRIFLNLF